MIERRVALTGVALPRHRISTQASETLQSWVDALASGDLRLWQLPDAVCALYWLGHAHGAATRDEEVHRLRVEADRYWLLAIPATDRRAYLLDRLDEAARLANRPDVDNVLDEAWRIYLAGLDTISRPIALHTTQEFKEVA